MKNFDKEKFEKKMEFEIENGLNEKRKEEIKKELETMSSQEINCEIKKIYEALNPVLYDNLNSYYDILEKLLYTLLEGYYVVNISKKINRNLKNQFNDLVNKTKLAIEFAKKYFYSNFDFESKEYLDLLFYDTSKIIREYEESQKGFNLVEIKNKFDVIHKQILENNQKIESENEKIFEEYTKLYSLTIELYINKNNKYTKNIKQLEELIEKAKINSKNFIKKEQLEEILKERKI